MGAIRRYLYSPLPQREAEQVAEFQASKQATMEEAAEELPMAEQAQRAEQEAKETTAVLSLTLSRHSLAQVVAALALLAVMAVQFVVLAALVRHTSELIIRVAAVLENLLAPDALAAPVAVVLVVTLSEQQEQQIRAVEEAAQETTIQTVAEAVAQAVVALCASAISGGQSDRSLAQRMSHRKRRATPFTPSLNPETW